ncbi:MAG: M67 family metallopeptidase [Syntrophorhabdaceae bacterium]
MIIEKDVANHIVAHAGHDAPIEACGYLLGKDGRITRHYPMSNAEGREDHFTFVPEEQFDAYKKARREGYEIIGAYHSHPVTPARPSEEDIKLLSDPDLLYVIVSLKDGVTTIKGFYIRDGKVKEEQLVIEEEHYE